MHVQNVIKLSQNCPKMFCEFGPRLRHSFTMQHEHHASISCKTQVATELND